MFALIFGSMLFEILNFVGAAMSMWDFNVDEMNFIWHVLLTFCEWIPECYFFFFFFFRVHSVNAQFYRVPDKNRIYKSELYKQLRVNRLCDAMPMIVRQGKISKHFKFCAFVSRPTHEQANRVRRIAQALARERERTKYDDDDEYMRCALEITCWKRWIGTYHT